MVLSRTSYITYQRLNTIALLPKFLDIYEAIPSYSFCFGVGSPSVVGDLVYQQKTFVFVFLYILAGGCQVYARYAQLLSKELTTILQGWLFEL